MGLSNYNIKALSTEQIKQTVREYYKRKWRIELNSKNSVEMYKMNKTKPREEQFYDNHPSSVTFLDVEVIHLH